MGVKKKDSMTMRVKTKDSMTCMLGLGYKTEKKTYKITMTRGRKTMQLSHVRYIMNEIREFSHMEGS